MPAPPRLPTPYSPFPTRRAPGLELTGGQQDGDEKSPYERALGDAFGGAAGLFSSGAAVEAAWRVVDPVLRDHAPVEIYEPGTWGPTSAAAIVEGEEGWHDPQPETSAPC